MWCLGSLAMSLAFDRRIFAEIGGTAFGGIAIGWICLVFLVVMSKCFKSNIGPSTQYGVVSIVSLFVLVLAHLGTSERSPNPVEGFAVGYVFGGLLLIHSLFGKHLLEALALSRRRVTRSCAGLRSKIDPRFFRLGVVCGGVFSVICLIVYMSNARTRNLVERAFEGAVFSVLVGMGALVVVYFIGVGVSWVIEAFREKR